MRWFLGFIVLCVFGLIILAGYGIFLFEHESVRIAKWCTERNLLNETRTKFGGFCIDPQTRQVYLP